jgi:hypothetical protein
VALLLEREELRISYTSTSGKRKWFGPKHGPQPGSNHAETSAAGSYKTELTLRPTPKAIVVERKTEKFGPITNELGETTEGFEPYAGHSFKAKRRGVAAK